MPFTPLSERYWSMRQLQLAVTAAPFAIAVVALYAAAQASMALLLLAASIACFGGAWRIELGRYRAWGYAERADDLVVRRGLMFRQVTVVPYGRMQIIDVTAGPLHRMFGLATVQLHTAAAATDARIPGLLQQEADRLRDRLASLGEAQATGL